MKYILSILLLFKSDTDVVIFFFCLLITLILFICLFTLNSIKKEQSKQAKYFSFQHKFSKLDDIEKRNVIWACENATITRDGRHFLLLLSIVLWLALSGLFNFNGWWVLGIGVIITAVYNLFIEYFTLNSPYIDDEYAVYKYIDDDYIEYVYKIENTSKPEGTWGNVIKFIKSDYSP